MLVSFAGRSFPVGSIHEAQVKWINFRELSGGGVSQIGNGVAITDDCGNLVARVSYNGRAWVPGEDAITNGALLAEAPFVDLRAPQVEFS